MFSKKAALEVLYTFWKPRILSSMLTHSPERLSQTSARKYLLCVQQDFGGYIFPFISFSCSMYVPPTFGEKKWLFLKPIKIFRSIVTKKKRKKEKLNVGKGLLNWKISKNRGIRHMHDKKLFERNCFSECSGVLLKIHLMKFMMMMNCFCGMVDWRKRLALFPAGTIVRDPHHRKSPTRREQDLNLRRTLVQA